MADVSPLPAQKVILCDSTGAPDSAIDVNATVDTTGLATSAKQDTGNTSLGSIDGKLGASAAPADAKTNASAAAGFVQAFLSVFNGTTWDRLRSGVTAVSATLTGMLNTLPWAQFNTTPSTRTTGQGGPLEADASGNLRVTEQFQPASSVTNITTATTTVVKSGSGRLARIIVAKGVVNATISVFDNTAGSGASLGVITCPATVANPFPLEFGCAFSTGLTVVTSGATDVTVVWD